MEQLPYKVYTIKPHRIISQIIAFLTFVGMWEKDDQFVIVKLLKKVFHFSIGVSMFAALGAGSFLSDDITETLFLGACAIAAVLQVVKLFYILTKRDKILSFLDDICVHTFSDLNEFNEIQQKLNIFAKLGYLNLYFMSFGIIGFLILSLPIFSSEETLPLNIGFPLDWKKNRMNYWLAHSFIIIGCLSAVAESFVSVITWFIMINCSIKYKTLGNQLRTMGKKTTAIFAKNNSSQMKKENLFSQYLIQLIETHRNILNLTSDVKSCFSQLFFAQMTVSNISICCAVYLLALRPPDNIFQFVMNCMVAAFNTLDLFVVMYQEWVERVSNRPVKNNITPQVCVVELGGTIGDIEGMPFVEAFRQFQYRIGRENMCCVHVSLIPTPRSTGEPKTKPTQASVRELRRLGLTPDLIVCRSEKEVGKDVKEKISLHCDVSTDQVICIPDLSSIYHVPLIMDANNIIDFLKDRLKLDIKSPRPIKYLQQWRDLAKKIDKITREVNISLVGKYTKLEDSYASVTKSLQHASTSVGYKLNLKFIDASHLEETTKLEDEVKYYEAWRSLCLSEGVIVPGGFGSRGIDGKILAAKWCRERGKPYLGICLGLQASVIEVARNVLHLKDANTTEIDPNTEHKLVIDMPEFTPEEKGGTMRLGARTSVFRVNDKSVIRKLYGNQTSIRERHRHRYEVNPDYVEELQRHGLQFVATDTEGKRMEIAQLDNHPYYVAVQFHPEYLSRPLKPSPPFLGLILASVKKLEKFLDHDCRLSPLDLSDMSDISSDEELQKPFSNIQVNGNGVHSSDESEENYK